MYLTLAAAITSVNARTTLCRYPYDNCGWVLASYGYTYEQLSAAANSTDGNVIYNGLYSCDTEAGDISFLHPCGAGGSCETGIVPNDNCK